MLMSSARSAPTATQPYSQWLDRLGPIAFKLLAALLFLLPTRQGIGIWPDSTRYMNMAATPWDAPLYPALLQLVSWSGIDIVRGAWAIGLVLAMFNPWLIWHILRRSCGRPTYAAFGTALIVISPQTVSLHALAMSEPLFLTLILATFATLIRYIRDDDSRWLIAAGVCIGLASLTRFTGPAVGAAIALFLLIDPRHGFARRVRNIGHILLPSALIFFGWVVLSQELNGRSTGRPLEWLGNMGTREWVASFNALTIWILPNGVPFAIRATLFITALAASLWLLVRLWQQMFAARSKGRDAPLLLGVPLAFFFFTYLAFMVLATAIETNLHLNGRYAYPIYCTSIMAAVIALAAARNATGTVRFTHNALVGLGLLMLASHGLRTAERTREAYREGVGYASRQWTTSPTLAAVSRLPEDAVLFSNGADVIGYALRRSARNIPAPFDLRTGRDEASFPYDIQLAQARAALNKGNAYIVFFKGVDWRFYMAPEGELIRQLDLVRVAQFPDGNIYRGRAQTEEGKP